MPNEERARVDLGGYWERHINGAPYDTVRVPSSLHPVGGYRLKRVFPLRQAVGGERVFLHFEGIANSGICFLNGQSVGEMAACVPYDFEITRAIADGNNAIEVAISDRAAGASWETYGGIIRDVYVEYRPGAFIENVHLSYELSSDGGRAAASVHVYVSSTAATSARIDVSLLHAAHVEQEVSLRAGLNELAIPFEVPAPALWSPEVPNLHTLTVKLVAPGLADTTTCRTGFRDLRFHGRDFIWNGQRLVLQGVCRYDTWQNQGFTLTREQVQQDLKMIKGLGANLVRLANFPHHRHVVEFADEIGLLVTEEPGLEPGLPILERMIRRDWNSPSVFGWLLGSGSPVDSGALARGRSICASLDGWKRPVSFANSADPKQAKAVFERAGLDYFSQQLDHFSTERVEAAAAVYGEGRPLVITEWGWDNPGRVRFTAERNFDQVLDTVEGGKIAGHAFRSWQDFRQYNRADWLTHDGICESGVVKENREPREWLSVELARVFQRRRHEVAPPATRPEPVSLRSLGWPATARFRALNLQPFVSGDRASKAWADLEASLQKYWSESRLARDQWKRTGGRLSFWRDSRVDVGGIGFECPVADGFVRPLVLTEEYPEIQIPVEPGYTRLHVLGHVTLPLGFPVRGKIGEVAATYRLQYTGGKQEVIPLRNGVEIAQSNLIHEATRIDPKATKAQRALVFNKDPVRERYQALLYSMPLSGRLDALSIRLSPGTPPLLCFGIAAELA